MTIPTSDPSQELIEVLERRSAALVQTHRGIHEIFVTSLKASKGDRDAVEIVRHAIDKLLHHLAIADDDLICLLREQRHLINGFRLLDIASAAKKRAEQIDIRIDGLRTRRAAAARRADAYRAKQEAKRSKYTTAYEAASKLSASKRRQLAEALLDS